MRTEVRTAAETMNIIPHQTISPVQFLSGLFPEDTTRCKATDERAEADRSETHA